MSAGPLLSSAGTGCVAETALPPSAYPAARSVCRHHARSFYFASFFLPRAKRRQAYAVYAFCRFLDDAVDEAAEAASIPLRLDGVEQSLEAIYVGRLPAPTSNPLLDAALPAFADTVRRCAIPRGYFQTLVDGCRMDLQTVRYATWEDLERYCYHVAGVVGLIMCRIFDLHDPAAEEQAVAMGNAMQLTNILRDVQEDVLRGRIYLPQQDLDRFGVTPDDLVNRRCDERFRALMRFEIARARGLYHQGSLGLCKLPRDGSRLTASVMATVYGGILDAIEAADGDVFSARRGLSLSQKLARLPAAWRLNTRTCDRPLPAVW